MEIVTLSIAWSELITTVHSPPLPSPLIGTLEYVLFAVPIPVPLSLITTTLREPSTALSLTPALLTFYSQSAGTGI